MKIAIVINDSFSAWIFRKGLIKALCANKDFQVYVLAPSQPKYVNLLQSIGAIHVPLEIQRFLSPWQDLKCSIQMYRFFRKERPDIVHNFTIKPNIYGTLTARLASIPKIICSATGLGYVYSIDASPFLKSLRFIVTWLYRIACRYCSKFSFQNEDDLDFFVTHGILPRGKGVLIHSSGIDLREFSSHATIDHVPPEYLAGGRPARIVLMVSRANWTKGVREFIEASDLSSKNIPDVRFLLVGELDEGPYAVPKKYLESKKSPHFEWLGFRENIRDLMAYASIVVLPSYYREGVPRCLLEAMAMAKPIVTTDNAGCRDTVEEARNGYLIPIKNSQALADAIIKLLSNETLMSEFGKYSRIKVEREFSETFIIRQTLSDLYEIMGPKRTTLESPDHS